MAKARRPAAKHRIPKSYGTGGIGKAAKALRGRKAKLDAAINRSVGKKRKR